MFSTLQLANEMYDLSASRDLKDSQENERLSWELKNFAETLRLHEARNEPQKVQRTPSVYAEFIKSADSEVEDIVEVGDESDSDTEEEGKTKKAVPVAPEKEKTPPTSPRSRSTNINDEKLRQFFLLPKSDEFLLSDIHCQLLTGVEVRGCMFISTSAVCFFASLSTATLPVLQGYLNRRRKGASLWHRKWFLVEDGVLHQMRSSSETPSYATRILNLKNVNDIQPYYSYRGKQFCFQLITVKGEKFVLQADNQSQMDEWMNHFKQARINALSEKRYAKLVIPFKEITAVVRENTIAFHNSISIFHNFQTHYLFTSINSLQIDKLHEILTEMLHKMCNHKDRLISSLHHTYLLSPSRHLDSDDDFGSESERSPTIENNAPQNSSTSSIDQKTSSVSSISQKSSSASSVDHKSISSSSVKEKSSSSVSDEPVAIDTITANIKIISNTAHSPPSSPRISQRVQQEFSQRFKSDATVVAAFDCTLLQYYSHNGTLYVTNSALYFYSVYLYYSETTKSILLKNIKSLVKEDMHPFNNAIRVILKEKGEIIFYNISERDSAFSVIKNSCIKRIQKETQGDDQELDTVLSLESSLVDSKEISLPPKPLKIVILTIGSRGDVQPYIAFAQGLIRSGHDVTIATHLEFKEFVTTHHVKFDLLSGNPRDLMDLCVSNGMFTVEFIKEATSKFRGFVDDLMKDCWRICQGCDVIIQCPPVMVAPHVAEKLKVPFFCAFTMPWTRTRAFPNPFTITSYPLGGTFNYMSYVMVDQMMWQPLREQVNTWRVNVLNLPPIAMGSGGHSTLTDKKIPFLYCFSSQLVPKPIDWPDWIKVTGFWFLDESTQTNYTPDPELMAFLKAGPPPVYIGFGSITCRDPVALTQTVVDAIVKSGQRAILAKGWGLDGADGSVEIPKDKVFLIGKCPHDFLFQHVVGVCHHGGAGTVAAGLKAGRPTVVVSFFGDQFFWGDRIKEMGLGHHIRFSGLTADNLAEALKSIATNQNLQANAQRVGQGIRNEDGVSNAVDAFHRYLNEYEKGGFGFV